MFLNLLILSGIRYNKLVSKRLGFRVLVRKISALNLKIDICAGVSGAAALKLTAYMMYELGLALSYIYNVYLRIPISIKLFLSSDCGRS